MLKKIITTLVLLALIHPVLAMDPVIQIDVPIKLEPTEGFNLNPEHPGTTFQLGENISFFNNDRNRRWFTVVCDKNFFDNGTSTETYMSFRQRTRIQLDEPGVYNFHLAEKPTVKIQITVEGDVTSTGVQQTDDRSADMSKKDELFPGLGELPAPGMLPAFMILILAFLVLRPRE